MGVKLLTYSETLDMTFKELSKYYNKQILKIDKSLKARKQYCDSFIEIEKSFVMALISSDESLDFDDFEIIIKQKDIEIDEIDDFDLVGSKLDELEKLMHDNEDKN